MLNDHISFALMLTASLSFAAWFARRHGRYHALGAGMAISLLAGTWFEVPVFQTPIDVRIATAAVLLVVYCTHSWRTLLHAINPLDALVTTLAIWHFAVDTYYDGNAMATASLAYGQWMLPYFAGRYAFLHRGTLHSLTPVFTFAIVAISIAAAYESLTYWNLWEFFTEVDDEVTRASGQRYGLLYRAIGPTRHPIFLGIVLLSLSPFAINYCSQIDLTPSQKALRCAVVAAICLGIFATVSRGPILCILIVAAVTIACANRTACWILIALVVTATTAAALNVDRAMRLFDSEGTGREISHIVTLDEGNSPAITTSSRHRIFVIQVYGPIVIKGGILGYGTQDSSGFPPRNLPGLPADAAMRQKLGIVDNSYINVGLRFGWVGLALFTALSFTSIFMCLRLAPNASTYIYPAKNLFCFAFAGTFIALMLEIMTVFWSFDFAFWVLFQMGVVGGLTSRRMLALTES